MASPLQQVPFACQICNITENLKRCAKCHTTLYCSRDHQVQDWKRHKKQCKSNMEAGSSTQSSKSPSSSQNATQPAGNISTTTPPSGENGASKDAAQSQVPEGFDHRPLKLFSPETVELNLTNIVEHVHKELTSKGFCVVDGLHDAESCENALREVEHIDKSGLMDDGKLAGGKTSGKHSEMRVEKGIRSDKIAWLHGHESEYMSLGAIVSIHDSIVGGLNTYLGDQYTFEGRTKAMVACYPGGGTFYGRHVDNPNKDGRCITCLFYLNPGWDAEVDGGVLRLLLKDGDYVDIAPIMNRILFFWSDRRSPHEVRPAFKKRYAITTWYFDKLERKLAKKEDVLKTTKNVQGKISSLELKTKEAEKEIIEQKIQIASQNAVGQLSPEEIEAFSVAVAGHPNPKALLSSMGLVPSIQDSLLEAISAMNPK